MHISNKTLSVTAIVVACVAFLTLWGQVAYRIVRAEAKIVALEAYDEKTTETMSEVIDLIEMVINRMNTLGKHPTGYQSVGHTPDLCEVWDGNAAQGRVASCEEVWRIRTDAEPPCLAQMEAAMRAVKPYLIEIDETHHARLVIRNFTSLEPALAQWAAAEHDCWRQP